MFFIISVSKYGRHVFSTDAKSIQNMQKLRAVYALFTQQFIASDGFTVDAIDHAGEQVTIVL